jgi:hypothetical protein
LIPSASLSATAAVAAAVTAHASVYAPVSTAVIETIATTAIADMEVLDNSLSEIIIYNDDATYGIN